MRRALILILGLIWLAAVGGQRSAVAARSSYGRARQIKVCNLLVPSTARVLPAYRPQGQNRSPHLFFVADRRTDVKPEDWEFVNPLAPPTLTQGQVDRWRQIGLGTAGAPPRSGGPGRTFAVGSPLTKDMAPYWEVVLAPENLDRLKEMDIVYLSLSGAAAASVSFTVSERGMLQRIADAGVLVWIDNAGSLRINNNLTQPGDLFFPLDFFARSVVGTLAAANDPGHPLLNTPFHLTSSDVGRLGSTGGDQSTGAINLYPTSSGPEPILVPVVSAGSPTIAAARYGSGFIVVTADNVGRAASWLEGGPGDVNNFAFSRADLTLAQNEDLKLVYNMAAWTAESTQFQRVPRHTGRTTAGFNGLLERWGFSFVQNPPAGGNPQPPSPNWMPPLLSRGMLFTALPRANPVKYSLHALELEPLNDFDGNGNPDDGAAVLRNDIAKGLPYDEIARVELPMTFIGGICLGEKAGVPILFLTGSEGNDVVEVANGVVYAFPAPTPGLPAFGNPAKFLRAGPSGIQSRNLWGPPVFADGMVYVGGGYSGAPGNTAGSEGIIRAVDFVNGNLVESWHYPSNSAPTSIGPVVSAPIVAHVEDSRTGAIDQVLFFTAVMSAASPGGLGGIVMQTHGEPLQVVNDPRTWAPGRRTESWDAQQWWDIRVINNSTGQTIARYVPTSLAKVEFNVDNQPGRIRLPDGFDPSLYSVVADYHLAGTPDVGSRVLTRRYWLPSFTPPGTTPTPTGVAAGPAVGPDDIVYYATGNGYIAAAQFVGGIPVLKWKVRTSSSGQASQYLGQSNLIDPREPNQFGDYQFVATPAVGDGIVYIAGRDGVVYAFETTTSFTLKVPSPNLPGQPTRLPMNSSRGANLVLYSNEGVQPRTNRVPPDSYVVSADTGTVTVTNFRNLTLDLSQATVLPQLGGRLGLPLDVDYIDIQGNQVQDTTFLPLNLLYTFTAGRFGAATRFSTPPVVAGEKVYVAGENGLLYELPADPRKDAPQFRTGSDLADYQRGALVRTREVSPNPILAPPAVGSGVVAVATAEGVTAYHSPRVNVADGNRIVEVAADSTALSATEATEKHQITGSEFPIPTDPRFAVLPSGTDVMTTKKSLNRPAVVRRLNRQKSITSIFYSSNVTEAGTVSEHSEMAETSTLVADAGNNRVVEFNASGKVVWEASSFQDPFRLLPTGETLKLSEPHDVQRWVDTAPDPQSPTAPPLLVFHTLVADTGNRRVLEIVDKVRFRQGAYTPDSYVTLPNQVDHRGEPVRWYHVLVWSSQTNAQGLKLAYRTAQRVPLTDAAGTPLRNPGRAASQLSPAESTVAPYLAVEPFQSATLVSVSNTQVLYESNPDSPNFRAFTQRNIPLVRPGGDSVFFLRSNLVDPDSGQVVPIRTPDPAAPDSPDRYIFRQGTVDQTLPIFRELWSFNRSTNKDEIVHTLNGISSLQRAVRFSRYFDSASNSFKERRTTWYLVADAGGVFEFRLDPELAAPPPGSVFDRRIRLGWAFTNDDYNWVTGGGNGNRDRLREPGTGPNAGRYVGGRGLTAASAQRLTNGQVLVVSRTSSSSDPQLGQQPGTRAEGVGGGGDIFTLRINDFDPSQPANGWVPDRWVQVRQGLPQNQQRNPSITWRTPAPRNPSEPPIGTSQDPAYNPLAIGGTYTPEQPTFADLVF